MHIMTKAIPLLETPSWILMVILQMSRMSLTHFYAALLNPDKIRLLACAMKYEESETARGNAQYSFILKVL